MASSLPSIKRNKPKRYGLPRFPKSKLVAFFYTLLGVESKECYRFYTDIKHRKNESRTYFMDKMWERLNEHMRRDDEKGT